jgi:hypothetical protein
LYFDTKKERFQFEFTDVELVFKKSGAETPENINEALEVRLALLEADVNSGW